MIIKNLFSILVVSALMTLSACKWPCASEKCSSTSCSEKHAHDGEKAVTETTEVVTEEVVK